LDSIEQQITGDPNRVKLADYLYDDLGRVMIKKSQYSPSGNTYQIYEYDISGINTEMESPYFSYKIAFGKTPDSGLTPRHDGQLAYALWGRTLFGPPEKGYSFTYDRFGQMTSAKYLELNSSTKVWTETEKFAETGITYDRNGNIKTLRRTDAAGNKLHTLEYNYDHATNGNALSSITLNGATSGTFTYDRNGNMTRDGQSGVQIDYNLLNLPNRIFAGSNEIKYIYSATGEKLAAESNGSLTYYRSVMVYEKPVGGVEQLSYMLHPEGTVTKTGTNTYVYNYFRKDHLGNVRNRSSSFVDNNPTDYYPFGLAHEYANTHLNRYLYGGKELQTATIGGNMLGLYDFHARFYNPAYGRWFNIDPALQGLNPYLYCNNSPMMYVDPDGKNPVAAVITILIVSKMTINYGSQVWMNYQRGFRGTDMWFNKVDFFDVAWAGIETGLSIAYPPATLYLKFGSPLITNAIDIYGDGSAKYLWRKGDIPVGQYFTNVGIDVASELTADAWKVGFTSDGVEDMIKKSGSEFFKSEFPKTWKELYAELFSDAAGTLGSERLRLENDKNYYKNWNPPYFYSADQPYKPYEPYNPSWKPQYKQSGVKTDNKIMK
jgi:RHS repeat-associated protein